MKRAKRTREIIKAFPTGDKERENERKSREPKPRNHSGQQHHRGYAMV